MAGIITIYATSRYCSHAPLPLSLPLPPFSASYFEYRQHLCNWQARDSSVWQVQSLFEEAVAADNALYKLPRKLAVCLPHCLPVCLAVCLFLLLSAQLSRACHYSLKASTNLPKLSSSWWRTHCEYSRGAEEIEREKKDEK